MLKSAAFIRSSSIRIRNAFTFKSIEFHSRFKQLTQVKLRSIRRAASSSSSSSFDQASKSKTIKPSKPVAFNRDAESKSINPPAISQSNVQSILTSDRLRSAAASAASLATSPFAVNAATSTLTRLKSIQSTIQQLPIPSILPRQRLNDIQSATQQWLTSRLLIADYKRSTPHAHQRAHVRIGNSLCDQEYDFVAKRNIVIESHIRQFMQIDKSSIDIESLPRIGIGLSGGGYRAMIGSIGSLDALQQMGIWHSTHYVAGLSGSTWAMAQIYHRYNKQNASAHESTTSNSRKQNDVKMSDVLENISSKVASSLLSREQLSIESLRQAASEKILSSPNSTSSDSSQSSSFSLIDLFSWLLESRLLHDLQLDDKKHEPLTLSEQSAAIAQAQLPMPLYALINDRHMQFEVNPYEFGSSELESHIPTWSLGRQFIDGKSIVDSPKDDVETNSTPEVRLSDLLACFGSAHCASVDRLLTELEHNIAPQQRHYIQTLRNVLSHKTLYGAELETQFAFTPFNVLNPFRQSSSSSSTSTSVESDNAVSNSSSLHLLDAGISFNLPFVQLLRPERRVDIILAFDYSSPPEALTAASLSLARQYAVVHSLPFPRLDRSEQPLGCDDDLNDVNSSEVANQRRHWSAEQRSLHRASHSPVSVFRGDLSRFEPTIIYIPLLRHLDFDDPTFCPRQNFQKGEWLTTLNFQYTKDQVNQLAGLTRHATSKCQLVIKDVAKQIQLDKQQFKARQSKQSFTKQ